MNQETIYDGDDVLVIGDDEYVHQDLAEQDDYLIVRDPVSDDPDDWCVLFISGDFDNFVVRFENIQFNTETSDLAYDYNILSTGEGGDVEYDMVDFSNHCTNTLGKILLEMHEKKQQVYTDVVTGEEIDY